MWLNRMARFSEAHSTAKREVRRYWEREPCGSSVATAPLGTPTYFAQVEAGRDELEPFIPEFADFPGSKGLRVLEIGIGAATDFIRFAREGARLIGVDLTRASVDLAKRRLAVEGLTAGLCHADAEALPFASHSFDLVYSWGVLHHSPDTRRALSEVRRVLAPGGEARVMLYSRRSWVALGTWIRHALLAGRPGRSLKQVIADHVESAGTKAYTLEELAILFEDFRAVEFTPMLTAYDIRRGGPIARALGPRFGWFITIRAHV